MNPQEKCLLKVEDKKRLVRIVELVRIILHFRNDEAGAVRPESSHGQGHQLELRIKSEARVKAVKNMFYR